jgi:hypothetical protein
MHAISTDTEPKTHIGEQKLKSRLFYPQKNHLVLVNVSGQLYNFESIKRIDWITDSLRIS